MPSFHEDGTNVRSYWLFITSPESLTRIQQDGKLAGLKLLSAAHGEREERERWFDTVRRTPRKNKTPLRLS